MQINSLNKSTPSISNIEVHSMCVFKINFPMEKMNGTVLNLSKQRSFAYRNLKGTVAKTVGLNTTSSGALNLD